MTFYDNCHIFLLLLLCILISPMRHKISKHVSLAVLVLSVGLATWVSCDSDLSFVWEVIRYVIHKALMIIMSPTLIAKTTFSNYTMCI